MSGARRGNPLLPKLGQLPAHEEDVQLFLKRLLEKVQGGAPLSLATLKDIWQELHFSYVFETRSMDIFLTEYVQCLFASALDCLEVPLRKTLSHQEEAGAPHEQHDEEIATACFCAEQQQEPAQATLAPVGAAADLAELAASEDDEEHQKDVQDIAATLRNSVTPSKTASVGGKAAADLDIDTVEAMLEDLPDVFDHLAETADDAGHGVDEGMTGGAAGTLREEAAWELDAYTVRAGSVLLLFALYHAQPGTPRVQIYVPLCLLRLLTKLLGSNADVDGALKSLVSSNAMVVGAIRRPLSGTSEARQAARPVRLVIAPDKTDQERIRRDAIATLKASASSWQSLQHVDLLCSSYRKCQVALWGPSSTTKAQGIFSLDLGTKLGGLARDIQTRVHGILAGQLKLRDRVRPVIKGASLREAIRAAEEQAREEGEPTGGEDGPAASGRQPERGPLSPATATASSGMIDEDMPSLDTLGLGLGLSGSGGGSSVEEEASDAAFEGTRLPKVLQLIHAREKAERNRARARMQGWQERNNALLKENTRRAAAAAPGPGGGEGVQAGCSGRAVPASEEQRPGGTVECATGTADAAPSKASSRKHLRDEPSTREANAPPVTRSHRRTELRVEERDCAAGVGSGLSQVRNDPPAAQAGGEQRRPAASRPQGTLSAGPAQAGEQTAAQAADAHMQAGTRGQAACSEDDAPLIALPSGKRQNRPRSQSIAEQALPQQVNTPTGLKASLMNDIALIDSLMEMDTALQPRERPGCAC